MKGDFFKKIFSSSKNFKMNVLALFVTGVLLLIISSSMFSKDDEKSDDYEDIKPIETVNTSGDSQRKDLEKRLSEILSSIEGAGNTKVMITMANTSEKVVAKDNREENSSDKGENSLSTKSVIEETTVSVETSGGTKEPFVLSENMPKVQGALIVSEGADNVYVKGAIIEATQALLNIPSHKVAVFKMK